MKINFYMMGFKGFEVLKSICSSRNKFIINTVISARDKNVSEDYFDQVKSLCDKHGIDFRDRLNLPITPADYTLLVGWKWLVPANNNTIVFHDSLLPGYRGFAPVVNALINGEEKIGATALFAADDYDSGPIIMQREIPVQHPLRIKDAIEKISRLYVDMAQEIIGQLVEGKTLNSYIQEESRATYSLWRNNDDYAIDWSNDSKRILRTIYALSYPYMGAQTLLNGEEIVIEDAEIVADVTIVNRQPGKVIFQKNNAPIVVCGEGLLKITSAFNIKTKETVLPLKKFRSVFGR